jgi:hypothetical protein
MNAPDIDGLIKETRAPAWMTWLWAAANSPYWSDEDNAMARSALADVRRLADALVAEHARAEGAEKALEEIVHEYRTAGNHGADGIDVIATIALDALSHKTKP